MNKNFLDILEIARENVQNNPNVTNGNTIDAAKKYLHGLIDEAEEVEPEIKKNNEIHLIDELGDIAWDYANLLALLERRGFISDVDEVLNHAHKKYTERTPAFLAGSEELWNKIKTGQKEELKKRHNEKYGV